MADPKQDFILTPPSDGKAKIVRPDQAKMEADVAKLEAEVKQLDARVEALEAEISARMAAASSNKAIAQEARATFNELRAIQERVKKEKEAINAAIDAAKASGKPSSSAAPGAGADRPRYKSEAEVDEAIARLELKQSSESLPLPAEKALLKQISDLRAVKQTFRAAIAAEEKYKRDKELADQSWKALQSRLSDKIAEQKAINVRVTEQRELLNKLAPRDDSIKTLLEEKAELKKQSYQKRQAIRTVRDEFYRLKKAFYEWQKEENARKDQERLLRQLQYQKQVEAEAAATAAAEEEEVDDSQPWAAEIDELTRLIHHLSKLSAAAAAPAAEEPAAAAAPTKGKKKGLRDDDELDFLSGALDARKPKKHTVVKQKGLALSLESLSLFSKYGLAPPTEVESFPSIIAALEEKKAQYAVMPPPEKPTKAAASPSTPSSSTPRTAVLTPYGHGLVATVRDDGVLVVNMSNFGAIAYLQQSQVRLVPRPRPKPQSRA